jgi:hypothetical protein
MGLFVACLLTEQPALVVMTIAGLEPSYKKPRG